MFTYLMTWVSLRMRDDERGQTSVEYALVIAIVAIGLALALKLGGVGIFDDFWNNVKNKLTT